MVFNLCSGCGERIELDDALILYDSEITCPMCETEMTVEVDGIGL